MEKEIIKQLILSNGLMTETEKLELINWLEDLIEKASMYDGLCE